MIRCIAVFKDIFIGKRTEVEFFVADTTTHDGIVYAGMALAENTTELTSVRYLAQGCVFTRAIDAHGYPYDFLKIEIVDIENRRNIMKGIVHFSGASCVTH